MHGYSGGPTTYRISKLFAATCSPLLVVQSLEVTLSHVPIRVNPRVTQNAIAAKA